MARTKPQYPPQGLEEMKTEMATSKPKNKIYKVMADEHRGDVTAELVTRRASELAAAADTRITLNDTEAVKRQTMLYLRACADTGSVPSFLGLARSLGFSRRALYDCIDKRSYPETADWLELARDTFSDILAESALTNNVNSVFAIFAQKAMYQWRESVEIIATPNNPYGENENTQSLIEAAKMLPDSDNE